ncbi:lipoyl(octanoyl) transferase LipB [Iodobacter sp. LRB]|uniref:lipoyl(octanoyl) transferase LipB n=1 Tax=unclassified Iodobacter TaxID=235634 RepID=UPI000C11DDD6|nr:lipoyl(octanoyl) transferase LipB [Iodobacter sp. BJB302]PHV02974.1 octanoyltransferase [Iodobacter sp. BJB302]
MPELIIKQLGMLEYEPTWRAMQAFTENRDAGTADEIWLVEHPPVYTQGQAGKPEHLIAATSIPVVQIDRGGQITYHGPGQVVAYVLLDLRRNGLGVRELVRKLEQSVIDILADFGVTAYGKVDAPGVYVNPELGEAKIASLGLRIRKGCSYHGLALNVNMDLTPFDWINPCGYAGMRVTQLSDFASDATSAAIAGKLAEKIAFQIKPLNDVGVLAL